MKRMSVFLLILCLCLQVSGLPTAYGEETVSGTFTVAAMNVAGLPIRLIGIPINEGGPGAEGTKEIGRMIHEKGWDFFSVSENFNYNKELMGELPGYQAGKFRGSVKWLTNNTDGLNLIWKEGITVKNETIISWEETYSSGIFHTGNGSDDMIDKGYRFYQVMLSEDVVIDVYFLHMDADSDPEDIKAREAELAQLARAVLESKNGNPIIIMGDTNCRYTRERLKTGFIDVINEDSRFTIKDAWVERCKAGNYPKYGAWPLLVDDMGYREGEIVDKMFFINNTDSNVTLTLDDFYVDTSFQKEDGTMLSDHYPVVGHFTYELNPLKEKNVEVPLLQQELPVGCLFALIGLAMMFIGLLVYTNKGTKGNARNFKNM